ncbi:uncharacterized protein LOC142333982 [Lycorma delicatula]|uniref:uncharacterized protein LOC142333982 n=1 Tax=Lycorma delicatula TaxID=130591 RepID=UPI003F514245
MTNFKLHYLFYKTKSKEMLIILLDYFDVKNIFDITNNLPSIITAAIRLGMDIKMIRRLIDRGGSINDRDVRHVSPLLQSIKSKRNVNFVKEILEMGANVNEICDDVRNTILHITVSNFCSGDDIEVIRLLIDSGANINAQNDSHEIPLTKLPLNADEDLWLQLIKRRLRTDDYAMFFFDKYTVHRICNRLLYLALRNNCCADCITEIIHNGAYDDETLNVNGDENDGWTWINTIITCDKVEIKNKLINVGADVNKCDSDGITPLMYAIKNNNNENIGRLINAKANVNAMDIYGRTSLYYAVMYCNKDLVDLLLNKGADISKISNGYDQFWFNIEVVKKSNDKFMAELITYFIRVSINKDKIRDVCGQTFLMYAIELNVNKNIIYNMLYSGANVDNVNATDNKGYSPLIYAIKYECDIDIIIKLIEQGADVNVIDNNGLTPLKHALHSHMFKEIIQTLIDNCVDIHKGADVNICDSKGLTPIMYAILYGEKSIKTEIISTLIESGAHNIKMCYDNIVEGVIVDDVNKIVEILERNTNEIKRIMTNFKLYYLFYKTKSKEMLIILLDYFDVKNIFDITNNLPSIITAAIRLGMDIKMIRRLIDRGGSINDTDVRHVSPLLQSIKSKRNVNFIKDMLELGANVNETCDYDRNSILHIAVSNFCYSDDIKVIKLLIDSGAGINERNLYRELPLMKLPLNADEDLWLELINGRLYIDQYTINYSLRDSFLSNVASKTSRIEQFSDILDDNRFPIDIVNKICNRLLYLALSNNCCADCITKIIHNGADVNEMKYHDEILNFIADENDCTKPLLIALKLNRDKEIISALIDNGADVNAIDGHGLTPLLHAINKNYKVEIINKLINLGADVNKCDSDGVTPLMYAIKNNNNENIKRLINAEASVNAMDIYGRTSLCYAVIYCNDEDVVNLLINKGADISKISDGYDQFWFKIEVVKKSNDKFMAELITNRNKDKIRDVCGQTFLMYAIELNMNKNIIYNMLHSGADINATDNKGYSPLIYAIKYECDIDIIIKLIEQGADVNVIDNNGLTPLKHALHSHMFKEIIQILIDNGVEINTHNQNNNILLLYLLKDVNYNKEHVNFVIQKGADVNICDNKGLTPIMYAILYGEKSIKTEIISILIESGAHVDAVNKDGHTALCHAFFQKNYENEILILLLDNGASVRKYLAYLGKSETPLIYAENYSTGVKIITELLYCKEDINEIDDNDNTSFLCKLFAFHHQLAFLLICDHKDLVKKDKPLIFNIFRTAPDIYVEKLFYSDLDMNDLYGYHGIKWGQVNYRRIVKLSKAVLEKHGYAELTDFHLNTPLHFSSSQDEINMLIIHANVDVTARNKYGTLTCHNVLQNGFFQNAEKPFIKHLLLVFPEELDRYSRVKLHYTDFINDCNVELNKMQSINIVDNLCFFKFCCKLSDYEMNLIKESENFCIYNDEQINQLFPIYYDIIIMKIKKCKIDLSKRYLINSLEKLIISNRIIKSYNPKKYEDDLNNCTVEHSDKLCECVFLNYDILYSISKYLYERHVVNLLRVSLYILTDTMFRTDLNIIYLLLKFFLKRKASRDEFVPSNGKSNEVSKVSKRTLKMFQGPPKHNIKMCYDNIVEGIVDDDVDKVVEILERNTDEIKRIMTNFKLYYLFYKTKSKEMLIILLDYFDVKNIFDITNNLPSIITAAIRLGMDIKMIRRLIDRGGSINDRDVRHVSPLLQSIKSKRNVNFIKEILEMGADVNKKCDLVGNSILHIAVSNFCSGDDIKVIKLLIDSGGNTNAENYFLETPIMKLPLNADEDLWLELIKRRLYIVESRFVRDSFYDTFLTNVASKTSRVKQFFDILNYNQFTTDTMNKICNRLLHLALKNNCSADGVIEIIHNGADVNEMKYHDEILNFIADENDCTKPLLIALKLNRDKEIISALIDNGADVNAIDGHGLTPLLHAINKNYKVEIINKLINLGADVNKCDSDGVTPLMYAIKNNNNENIKRLINAEASVNAMDIYGRTSLCYAVMYCNDEDVVNLLINKGADISKISDGYDQFWFNIEVVKKSNDKFMAELITNRNKDKIRDVCGQTFLVYAIELNMNKNIIYNMLHSGADINATDNKGYSPLIYAIKYECDIDIIIKLIEQGADVNVIDNNGLTPLKHALHSHMFKEIIQILIDNGVEINTNNENNNILLLYLLKDVNYNKEHVNFVIQKGADVNICDNKGLTPIMYAILYGEKSIKTEIISILIESGAHVDAVDKDGHTALCHAFFQKNYENKILILLLDNGASVRKYLAYLGESETPLINAVRCRKRVEIIIELLYCKEDINENDKYHKSFLSRLYTFNVELAFLLISDHKDLLKKDKSLIFNIFKSVWWIYFEKIFFCSDLNINDLDEVHQRRLNYTRDKKKIVKLMKAVLEKCCYAKLTDSKLNTPLHFTVLPDVINVLIIYGNADVTARNNIGEITCHNVLQYRRSNYSRIVPFIKHLLLVLPEELDRYSRVKLHYTDFINDCNVELNKMQSINIVDNLCFFKFCCKLSDYEMNLIKESGNFCVYNDERIKQLFPIYSDIIIMKIKKCKIDFSKRYLINALEKLIISNRIIKSYNPKKYEADKNNCCTVEHSDKLCECVFLNYDVLYFISKYLYERHIVKLLLASL